MELNEYKEHKVSIGAHVEQLLTLYSAEEELKLVDSITQLQQQLEEKQQLHHDFIVRKRFLLNMQKYALSDDSVQIEVSYHHV